MTTLVRYPLPHWPEQLERLEGEASFDRFDDHLDDAAIQARREEIDRLAERSGLFAVTDDQAVSGGSFWLSLFALAAAVATICMVGVLVYVLGH
jgi:hypothetical protein